MMNAKRARGWLVVWALAAGQWACTSLRPVGSTGDAVPIEAIEVGDRVTVVDARGAATELLVTAVGAGFVEARAADDTLTRLTDEELDEVRVRRNAPGKTAGLAAALSLLLFVEGLSEAGVMQ